MRKLRYHEKKLLKKVDFINWNVDNNLHEIKMLRRYRIQNRDDYTKYKKLSREIRNLAQKLLGLPATDAFRQDSTAIFLQKLYAMGLIPTRRSLELADKVSASAFCRRRLATFLVRSKMAENFKAAVTFIEHGHVRVGTEVVMDPAFLVTRNMEDFVTWTRGSAIKQHVMKYNEALDDYELMN